jgi:hypothetical protein
MATITKQVDDLDGTDAAGTFDFGLDGKDYEIDLSAANAQKLRDALAPFIQGGRRVKAKPEPIKPKRRHPEEVRAIRQWVIKNGGQVSEFGRIRNKYLEAWDDDRDESVFES